MWENFGPGGSKAMNSIFHRVFDIFFDAPLSKIWRQIKHRLVCHGGSNLFVSFSCFPSPFKTNPRNLKIEIFLLHSIVLFWVFSNYFLFLECCQNILKRFRRLRKWKYTVDSNIGAWKAAKLFIAPSSTLARHFLRNKCIEKTVRENKFVFSF